MNKADRDNAPKLIAGNRKASHQYHLEEKMIAGIALAGTEVKSCRAGNVQLRDAFVRLSKGEAYLVNAHISHYSHGNISNHDPLRIRKLLLTRRELRKLAVKINEKGYTVVPTAFLIVRGLIKVQIALARGKHSFDKREALKARTVKRETERYERSRH